MKRMSERLNVRSPYFFLVEIEVLITRGIFFAPSRKKKCGKKRPINFCTVSLLRPENRRFFKVPQNTTSTQLQTYHESKHHARRVCSSHGTCGEKATHGQERLLPSLPSRVRTSGVGCHILSRRKNNSPLQALVARRLSSTDPRKSKMPTIVPLVQGLSTVNRRPTGL